MSETFNLSDWILRTKDYFHDDRRPFIFGLLRKQLRANATLDDLVNTLTAMLTDMAITNDEFDGCVKTLRQMHCTAAVQQLEG